MMLEQAVLELVINATQRNFDPTELRAPGSAHTRCFEHKGKCYRATLTRMKGDKAYIWLLSVTYNPNTVAPTEEEGAEIASAFFEKWEPVPKELDILKWSRKYIMQEMKKQ